MPARLRAVWVSGLLSVLLFGAIALYLAPLEPNIVALQFAPTPASFAAVIHRWPTEHLARYRAHLFADFGLLLSYGGFGFLCATRTRLFSGLSARLNWAARWVLPAAAAFDAAEDVLHLWLTQTPRFGHPTVYLAATAFSAAKWGLLLAFGVLVVLALLGDDPVPRQPL